MGRAGSGTAGIKGCCWRNRTHGCLPASRVVVLLVVVVLLQLLLLVVLLLLLLLKREEMMWVVNLVAVCQSSGRAGSRQHWHNRGRRYC